MEETSAGTWIPSTSRLDLQTRLCLAIHGPLGIESRKCNEYFCCVARCVERVFTTLQTHSLPFRTALIDYSRVVLVSGFTARDVPAIKVKLRTFMNVRSLVQVQSSSCRQRTHKPSLGSISKSALRLRTARSVTSGISPRTCASSQQLLRTPSRTQN